MTRRIILHIGSPKCGSTYLQQALLQSAGALRAAGIHYPHDGGGHPGNAADLADLTRPRLETWFGDGIHTVILSHEDLYGGPRRGDALARLVREDDTQVQLIAFLRPFSEFIFGDYSQFMKQYFYRYLETRNPYDGRSFTEFAERRVETLKPATFLSNWDKRFPDPGLILDSHRNIRLVLERLLGTGGPIDWEVPRSQTNPSLRMADCDAIAAAMRDPTIPDNQIRAMFQEAFHHTADPDPGKSAERVAWLEEIFEPKNAALMRRFGFDNRVAPRATAPQ
ncbi:hypothetical protein [Aestuariicoccus sp. MJ-SS9]|uniref:hypothetical protein n=1 Tax=Aestuariicoccus sp. MJ-SS9 TaxID=3079855 RepID=UPI0029081F26|nr:hypothetical protein [Aestuariicoccus sp. MJ-SS9]MDU8912161.1 hypothetical protein [Aestuariicoccus sp. MJ-SS9]